MAAYVCAATLSAVAVGALLGYVGALIPREPRIAIATFSGVIGAGLGALDVQKGLRPLQCDRETPQSWVDLGAVRWALVNGTSLGIGAWSRLGFWLWYVIPIGSVLMADPLSGATIYGTYGFVRSAGALGLMLAARRTQDFQQVADSVLRHAHMARLLAGCYLLMTGLAVSVGVGL